jgi:hypothetical protein
MDKLLTDEELLAFIEAAANRGHTIATTRLQNSDRLAVLELTPEAQLVATGIIDERQEQILQTTHLWRERIHRWVRRVFRKPWRQWASS